LGQGGQSFRSAAFYTENIYFLFLQNTSYFNEEAACTEPSRSVRVPFFNPLVADTILILGFCLPAHFDTEMGVLQTEPV